MGLKSRRKLMLPKKTRAHAPFTWDDVWEMISYLDFCLILNPEHQHFKNTIAVHLEKRTGKLFSIEQIDRKIRQLWEDEGIKSRDQYNHDSIYYYGSIFLRCVQDDPELKDKIQRRTEEIRKEKAFDYVKLEGRTRRSKPTELYITLDHDGGFVRRFRPPKKVYVEVPTHRHREENANKHENLEIPLSMDGMSCNSASFDTTTSSHTVSAEETLQTSDTRDQFMESQDDHMSVSGFHSLDIKQQSAWSSTGARSFTQPEHISAPTTQMRGCMLSDQHTFGESQSRIAKLQRENAWYREEVDELKQRIAELSTQLTSTIVSKFGDDSTQKRLIHYQTEVRRLKSIINDKDNFKPFTRSGPQHLNKDERVEIKRNLEAVEREIGRTFIFSENMGPCTEGVLGNETGDLSTLWGRALGSSTILAPPIPFPLILRSLLSAALCLWVFESYFDDSYLANSHPRQTMLSHLSVYDGEEVARNLDLATHKTLIANEYFQNVHIPMLADELVDRLSNALHPLLKQQKARGGLNINVSAKWEKQKDIVKRIFETALRIKLTVLVSNDVYEVIFPAYGEVFTKELMKPESKSAVDCSDLVLLTVAPGLRGFECDRGQIDYNGFRPPGSFVKQEFDRIGKALVILK